MKLKQSAALILMSFFVLTAALAQDGAEMRRQEIDQKAASSLEELFGERANARALYDQAVGYAVFTATKAGFVVSGGRGTGVAVNRQTGSKTYMRMITGGFGLGIGAQKYDLILLFQTEGRLNEFLNGSWDANASAQAAAGTDGVGVATTFINGVAVYQVTDTGLMAWADVSGTRFRVIRDLN